MSFGRNPHVPKAEAAELKARAARDASSRERAWREAARLWERAIERETEDKRRQEYAARAETARAFADGRDENSEDPGADELKHEIEAIMERGSTPSKPTLLN